MSSAPPDARHSGPVPEPREQGTLSLQHLQLLPKGRSSDITKLLTRGSAPETIAQDIMTWSLVPTHLLFQTAFPSYSPCIPEAGFMRTQGHVGRSVEGLPDRLE